MCARASLLLAQYSCRLEKIMGSPCRRIHFLLWRGIILRWFRTEQALVPLEHFMRQRNVFLKLLRLDRHHKKQLTAFAHQQRACILVRDRRLLLTGSASLLLHKLAR